MDVDPGYKDLEKFRGGVQWNIMEPKNFLSRNMIECFKNILITFFLTFFSK